MNRPPIGRIRRIHTDLIRADPSDPPNRWSIHPSDASNTDLGHYLPLVATNRLRDTGDCPDKALSLSAIPFVDWGHYVEDMG